MHEPKHFAICVRNDGYEGTLELRKVYEVLEDESAQSREFMRIIDESGEDYLYPKSWFVALELPSAVEEQILQLTPNKGAA